MKNNCQQRFDTLFIVTTIQHMQLLTSEQIHSWDTYTINQEKITSLDLMERAASGCITWLEHHYINRHFIIYCGKGNNGGDGLALARLLLLKHFTAEVFIIESHHKGTEDFQANLARLEQTGIPVTFVRSEDQFNLVPPGAVLIDAIFGSGLNRPADGIISNLINHINDSGNDIIAIDIPSGMFADKTSKGNSIINAHHTLTFQTYKLALLLPENEEHFGEVHVLAIGLSPVFLSGLKTMFEILDKPLIRSIYKPRKSFAHKGSFGHALMLTGSYGKMGAAVLSSRACLRSGAGLVSVCIPSCGYDILQTSVPEAMAIPDTEKNYLTKNSTDADLSIFNAIGIGPGIGTQDATAEAVDYLFSRYTLPVVIDADCLNILAKHTELFKKLAPLSILTPHPKEFERLFGKTENDFERIILAKSKAKELQVIIILKGHKTLVVMPDGKAYFNNTGNAGMATGGSGDVLTGILTGLLAQKYKPESAALLGVYIHGMAGDYAAEKKTQESMIASDITDSLGDGFRELST